MSQIKFKKEGLAELAKIARRARGDRTYPSFQALTGLSHATLWKLETSKLTEPTIRILNALAPFTPYSCEQLISIGTATSASNSNVRYLTATDALPDVEQLPASELAELISILLEKDFDKEQWQKIFSGLFCHLLK